MMPGAWYDLAGRVSTVQAIASCALEALPNGLQGMECERVNHAGNLIAAMQDILKLIQQDVNTIETALKL